MRVENLNSRGVGGDRTHTRNVDALAAGGAGEGTGVEDEEPERQELRVPVELELGAHLEGLARPGAGPAVALGVVKALQTLRRMGDAGDGVGDVHHHVDDLVGEADRAAAALAVDLVLDGALGDAGAEPPVAAAVDAVALRIALRHRRNVEPVHVGERKRYDLRGVVQPAEARPADVLDVAVGPLRG